MASGLRKMAVYLGLVEDSSYDEYDEYEETRSRRRGFADDYSDDYSDRDYRNRDHKDRDYNDSSDDRYGSRSVRTVSEPRGAVRTFRADDAEPRRAQRPLDLSRIETVHPRTYNDARRIGEEFRNGVPVIMNLGEMDDADAKRIIDFAAGLVFGVRGSIERITNKVFLLSPVNVDVGDQARAQVAQDDFFNQS